MTPFIVIYLFAAVWRLSNLFANENGPFHLFLKLRSRIARAEVRSRKKNGLLSKLHLHEGVNCEYCNSIWFGIFFAVVYFIDPQVAIALAFPLALSTGAILIKHIVFLIKSIDTRLDQQNQTHLKLNSQVMTNPKWDATPEKSTIYERR